METLSARARLTNARTGMLRVHRALLEAERALYEREFGRIPNSGTLLQLILENPWFQWLRPMSQLIVQIDDWLEADQVEPGSPDEAEILLAEVRDRLTPNEVGADFQKRYLRLIQEDPAVAVAHAAVRPLVNS
jgi:hypothetical protein